MEIDIHVCDAARYINGAYLISVGIVIKYVCIAVKLNVWIRRIYYVGDAAIDI
jgi:hypothetical protein